MTADVLAIGAHPDDADIGVGAILCKLARNGLRTAVLDLTAGELGTRGTPEERKLEAAAAANRLGVNQRVCAELPDGALANTYEQRLQVVTQIRNIRPKYLLAPLDNDRHPDHDAAHFLVRDSAYLAGLRKIDTGQEPHRPESIYYYRVYGDPTEPSIVVDVSDCWQDKLEALRAFASQLHNPQYAGEETFVASEAFWEGIELRGRYWGQRTGVRYGEPLYYGGPLPVATPPGWI